ncbi:MAG: biotin--[acetyl-CoA-carboxylase] ligase [Firmicutes bacterium]|nr:biotin--[acetyl-CoA-carboxylase] ligase [Bacillota bacterium]
MKKNLLDLLAAKEGYVSGEDISQELGVSRTAVWKQVRSLRELGYDIDAQPRQGYRLRLRPDRLLPAEIARGLNTGWMGREVVYLEETDSTNEVAKKLAREGAREGTIVVAEHQSRGKGRQGRQWESPPYSGVYFTVILRPSFAPRYAPRATLMAAVAVARGIKRSTGLEVRIKWPNDILLNEGKVVGILTEMSSDMDSIHHLVIGIGININHEIQIPSRYRYPATSLQSELKSPVSRLEVLQRCLEELEKCYDEWVKDGFANLLDEWRAMSHTLGRWVKVNFDEAAVEGTAEDVEEDGSLLLRQKDGSIFRVVAGEVLFPKTAK